MLRAEQLLTKICEILDYDKQAILDVVAENDIRYILLGAAYCKIMYEHKLINIKQIQAIFNVTEKRAEGMALCRKKSYLRNPLYKNYAAIIESMLKYQQEPEELLKKICDNVGIAYDYTVSTSRRREAVTLRGVISSLFYSYGIATLTVLGTVFNRHHSTMLTAINTSNYLMNTDKYIQYVYKEVKDVIDDLLNIKKAA